MQIKLILLIACLLALNGAHAQVEDLEQMIMNDSVLKEKYGGMCTSINGIEFSSLPKPEVSLQELIDSAEDGETINITTSYNLLNETLHINKNMTVIGVGMVIADANRSCEILHIEDPNLTVKIENIAFVNGRGDHGGAIDNAAEELTLDHCLLSNNVAHNGSCIHNTGDELTIKDCRMVSNFAADYGSCIFDRGSQIYAENVTFKDNYADKMGGIIYGNGSEVTLINCELRENNATKVGAAIYSNFGNVRLESSEISSNNGSAPLEFRNATIVLKDCNISNNLGPYNNFNAGYGGGVLLEDCSALIENCEIRNNKAIYFKTEGDPQGFGGFAAGIFIAFSKVIMNDTIVEGNEAFGNTGVEVIKSSLVVNRGSISRNIARKTVWYDQVCNGMCGGISICNESKVTLNGVALVGNQADDFGGAICNSGQLDLIDTTIISNNATTTGGGIYNKGTIKIDGHTIFLNNKAQDGGAIYNIGTIELKGSPDFTYNEARDTGEDDYYEGMGGAIFSTGNMTIENAIFTGNNAISGSAIWSEGNLTDTDSHYYDNHATASGTIFHTQQREKAPSTMILNNTAITNNTADQCGGGIYLGGQGILYTNNAKIKNNIAKGGTGGGVYLIKGSKMNRGNGDISNNTPDDIYQAE